MTTAIDLFAGAGGSSAGLRLAGLRVLWAANHDATAVAVHEANHPETVHVKQDLALADWGTVPAHDLLWASPACQGHSQGASRGGDGRRGSAPAHDAMRSTAWAVVDAVECLRPRALAIENVPEFRRWPLFSTWKAALGVLGYGLTETVVDAAALGCPQERRRLFVFGARGRTPRLPDLPARAPGVMADHVDLDAGRWRPLSTLPPGARVRVRRAIELHAGASALMVQAVTGHPGRALNRPFPTVTTKHQMGLVRRDGRSWVYRPFLLAEYSAAMGLPPDYDWLDVGVWTGCRLAGNAVVPEVARWVATAAIEAA